MSRSTRASKHVSAKSASVKEEMPEHIDVNYNPEIIQAALSDLELQMNSKCKQIQKDAEFMCTSIKQAFHLELIKLPNQVKTMSLSRFRSEFGDSLEAVTRGAIGKGKSSNTISSANGRSENIANKSSIRSSGSISSRKSSSSSDTVFQTPSGSKSGSHVHQTPSTSLKRQPKEGEILLSANGSPLGEYDSTCIKPKGPGSRVPPTPTPGTSANLELASGLTVNVEDINEEEIASMTAEVKTDALQKMQAMMANMQAMMDKLQQA